MPIQLEDIFPILEPHLTSQQLDCLSRASPTHQQLCQHHHIWQYRWQQQCRHLLQLPKAFHGRQDPLPALFPPPPFPSQPQSKLIQPYRHACLWLHAHQSKVEMGLDPWPKALRAQAPMWLQWLKQHQPALSSRLQPIRPLPGRRELDTTLPLSYGLMVWLALLGIVSFWVLQSCNISAKDSHPNLGKTFTYLYWPTQYDFVAIAVEEAYKVL